MESVEHRNLVDCILNWIDLNFNNVSLSQLQIDNSNHNPIKIYNSIPDVFFEDRSLIIIGEAKSLEDYDRQHSIGQYHDYLNYLNNKNGYLIFACKWRILKSFKELIAGIIIKNKIVLVNQPIYINGDLIE